MLNPQDSRRLAAITATPKYVLAPDHEIQAYWSALVDSARIEDFPEKVQDWIAECEHQLETLSPEQMHTMIAEGLRLHIQEPVNEGISDNSDE
jgi:hypothetical protein